MTPRIRLLAAAAACLGATTAVYLLAVRTTRGQLVENLAMEGRPIEDWWVHDPTSERLGAIATVLAVGGAVAVVAWAARRFSVRSAVVVAASIAAALAVTEVLKHVVIDRPALVAVGDRVYLEPNTFPSGHSTVAVSAAIAAVALAPRGRRAVVGCGADMREPREATLRSTGRDAGASGRPAARRTGSVRVVAYHAVALLRLAGVHPPARRTSVRVLRAGRRLGGRCCRRWRTA